MMSDFVSEQPFNTVQKSVFHDLLVVERDLSGAKLYLRNTGNCAAQVRIVQEQESRPVRLSR